MAYVDWVISYNRGMNVWSRFGYENLWIKLRAKCISSSAISLFSFWNLCWPDWCNKWKETGTNYEVRKISSHEPIVRWEEERTGLVCHSWGGVECNFEWWTMKFPLTGWYFSRCIEEGKQFSWSEKRTNCCVNFPDLDSMGNNKRDWYTGCNLQGEEE